MSTILSKHIIIDNMITSDYIFELYSKIENTENKTLLLLYKIHKDHFYSDLKKYTNLTLSKVDDLFSIDKEEDIKKINLIKEKMILSVDKILLPMINIELKNVSNIHGYYMFFDRDKLYIVSSYKNIYSVGSVKEEYALLSLLSFILNS